MHMNASMSFVLDDLPEDERRQSRFGQEIYWLILNTLFIYLSLVMTVTHWYSQIVHSALLAFPLRKG